MCKEKKFKNNNTKKMLTFTGLLLLFCVLCVCIYAGNKLHTLEQKQETTQRNIASLQKDLLKVQNGAELNEDALLYLAKVTDKKISNMQKQMLTVHECAQMQEFVQRAKFLCFDEKIEYYCEVLNVYDSHCLLSEDGKNLSLPENHGVNLKLSTLTNEQ